MTIDPWSWAGDFRREGACRLPALPALARLGERDREVARTLDFSAAIRPPRLLHPSFSSPRSVCRGGGGLSSSSLVRLLGHLLALTTAQSATRRPRVGGPRPPPPPFRFQSFRLSVVCVGFLRRRQRLHLLLLCYSRRDVTTLGRRRQPPLGQSSNGTGNETDNKRAPRTDLTSEKIETLEQLENGRSKCAEGGAKVAAYNKVVTEVAHALSSLPPPSSSSINSVKLRMRTPPSAPPSSTPKGKTVESRR